MNHKTRRQNRLAFRSAWAWDPADHNAAVARRKLLKRISTDRAFAQRYLVARTNRSMGKLAAAITEIGDAARRSAKAIEQYGFDITAPTETDLEQARFRSSRVLSTADYPSNG